MNSVITAILKDKLLIVPLIGGSLIFFAYFGIETSVFTVQMGSSDPDKPGFFGAFVLLLWFLSMYKPPPERTQRKGRPVSLSYVTRNLAERVRGTIVHDAYTDWMLFTDAVKLPTEFHDLPHEGKNDTLNGLQLDLAISVGVLDSGVLPDGQTVVRKHDTN